MSDHTNSRHCLRAISIRLHTADIMLQHIIRTFFMNEGPDPDPKRLEENYVFLLALLQGTHNVLEEADDYMDLLKAD